MTDAQRDQHLTSLEAELVSRLADEYKILQDKIDKIGAFRFTIKGWSITVIVGSIVAGAATTNAVPRWLSVIVLLGFVIAFFLFERQQTNHRHRFGQRALDIEAVLSRLFRNTARESGSQSVTRSFIVLHFVPGIGHHLGDRHTRRRGPRTFWRSCYEADVVFYIAQAVVVLGFLFWRSGPSPDHHGDAGIGISTTSKGASAETPNNAQRTQTSPSSNTSTQPGSGSNEKETKKKEKHKSN